MVSFGQILYEHYAQAQLELNNCIVDSWKDLTEGDKAAWDAAATKMLL